MSPSLIVVIKNQMQVLYTRRQRAEVALKKRQAEIELINNALVPLKEAYNSLLEMNKNNVGGASYGYKPKPCVKCGKEYQPGGPRAEYCDECKKGGQKNGK